MLPSYRNQSINLLSKQLTGFYKRATLKLNGLNGKSSLEVFLMFSEGIEVKHWLKMGKLKCI